MGIVLLTVVVQGISAGADALDPPRGRLPNVVVIAVDTLRSDHLGCYGYGRSTSPSIDRLATEGVVFEQCYSVASWTLPSFASMFTGLLPASHGCMMSDNKIPDSLPVLGEKMQAKGYTCIAVVSNPYLNAKYGFGRGFDQYDDYTVFLDAELGLLAADASRDRGSVNDMVTGATVTRQATAMLKKAAESKKPFFLFVLYFDPHDSYVPTSPYLTRFASGYTGAINGRGIEAMRHNPPDEEDLAQLINLYDAEIAYTDAQIGRLLEEVGKVSKPQDTLTVLVSDHGEAFGEHGKMLHGNSAHREEVQVPMIWHWPGVIAGGHRVTSTVANFDVASTLVKLLDLEGMDNLQCESLWPGLLGGQLPAGRYVFTERAHFEFQKKGVEDVALTQGNWRLHGRFHWNSTEMDPIRELFDVSTDPSEHSGVAGDASSRVARMSQTMHRVWADCLRIREQCLHESGGIVQVDLTDQERKRLEALKYVAGDAGQ